MYIEGINKYSWVIHFFEIYFFSILALFPFKPHKSKFSYFAHIYRIIFSNANILQGILPLNVCWNIGWIFKYALFLWTFPMLPKEHTSDFITKANGKTEFDILGFLYRQVVKNAFILQNNRCLDFHFRNIQSSVGTQASKRTYVNFHLACSLATGSVAKWN